MLRIMEQETRLTLQEHDDDFHFYCYLVGFTLSQATKALRESRGIALLYFRPLH